MVWNPSQSQRTPQSTTLLVLPPLPVTIIAEQWDEQLPGGSAVWLDDEDEDEDEDEDDAEEVDDANGREEETVIERGKLAVVNEEVEAMGTEDEGYIVGGKRKREDVDDDDDKDNDDDNDNPNHEDKDEKPNHELSIPNLPQSSSLTTNKRKREESNHIAHPKPISPTSSSHPYQQPPTLTKSHIQPDVIETARLIASKHGIKLAISSDELIKLDLTAYQNALIDPSTIGNGTIALARARRMRMNGNGSVDGAFEDGTASPGPMSVAGGGGGGYATPGPSAGGGTPTPSTPTGGRNSGRNRNKGMGRWGHLYAKRAQQAAAAAAAAKQAEEAASAAAALASAQAYLAAQSVVQVDLDENTSEVDKDKMEKQERERAEEGLAMMKAMEEKKKETMAKGLGSASYWNHLLIEARRQRGPQWDVNTQSYQVDRGSALYYSNVHGPPPSPPPASPPKLPQDLQARPDLPPPMGSRQPIMAMQMGGAQQPQRPSMSNVQGSYSGVQADPRLQYPPQQLPPPPPQQQAQVPQWMMGVSGVPQQQGQQRSVSGTPAGSDGQRPGSSGRQSSITHGTPSMQNQQPSVGMSASTANRDNQPLINPAQVLAQRQQSTSQQQLAQMQRSLQDQQAAQQQQQLLTLQAQRHRDMMAARMAGLQAAGGSPSAGLQQQQQSQQQQQHQRGQANNLSVGLNGGQWPMMQGLTAAQLAGLQQSYQASAQQQPQQTSQQFMQQGGMFPGMNMMAYGGGGVMGKPNVQGMQMPQMGQYAQQQQQQQQQ